MGHGAWKSGRRGDHINLPIQSAELLFQYDHGKCAGACRHISGTGRNRIGCSHPGSCVSFRRAQRNPGLQTARFIQKCGALFGQRSRVLPGCQNLRKNVFDFPVISAGFQQAIELRHHGCVIVESLRVNGKHPCRVSNADHPFSCQLPMDIAAQCRHIIQLCRMCFLIQDALVQVGRCPPKRDVEVK